MLEMRIKFLCVGGNFNSLTTVLNFHNSFVGIKQLVFGGTEFENWRQNLTSEDAGYSVHKI